MGGFKFDEQKHSHMLFVRVLRPSNIGSYVGACVLATSEVISIRKPIFEQEIRSSVAGRVRVVIYKIHT